MQIVKVEKRTLKRLPSMKQIAEQPSASPVPPRSNSELRAKTSVEPRTPDGELRKKSSIAIPLLEKVVTNSNSHVNSRSASPRSATTNTGFSPRAKRFSVSLDVGVQVPPEHIGSDEENLGSLSELKRKSDTATIPKLLTTQKADGRYPLSPTRGDIDRERSPSSLSRSPPTGPGATSLNLASSESAAFELREKKTEEECSSSPTFDPFEKEKMKLDDKKYRHGSLWGSTDMWPITMSPRKGKSQRGMASETVKEEELPTPRKLKMKRRRKNTDNDLPEQIKEEERRNSPSVVEECLTSEPHVKSVGILGLKQGFHLIAAVNKPMLNNKTRTPNIEVKAVWDIDIDTIGGIPDLYGRISFYNNISGYLPMLEMVDLVGIYSMDPTLRLKLLMETLKFGKNVIIEHPLIINVQQAKILNHFLENTLITGELRVVQTTQVIPSFIEQHKKVSKGVLGDVQTLQVDFTDYIEFFSEEMDQSKWRPYYALSHVVTLLRCFILGVEQVHAFGLVSEVSKKKNLTEFDIYRVNIISKTGQISTLNVNCSERPLPNEPVMRCKITGTKGSSMATYPDMTYTQRIQNDIPTKVELLSLENAEYYFDKADTKSTVTPYGCYATYLNHFVKLIALERKTSLKPNFVQGLETFIVIEAIVRSANEKRPVKIKEIRKETKGE